MDERRRALRREGVTRAVARERAWEDAEKAFPPLSRQEIVWRAAVRRIAIGEFPPVRDHQPVEARFADYWRVWCCLLARFFCWQHDELLLASMIASKSIDPAESQEAQAVAVAAALRPLEFCCETMPPVLKEATVAALGDDELLAELRSHLGIAETVRTDGIESVDF